MGLKIDLVLKRLHKRSGTPLLGVSGEFPGVSVPVTQFSPRFSELVNEMRRVSVLHLWKAADLQD